MASRCYSCGRGPRTSFTRSHSNIATKRRQGLNLQKTSLDGKRILICTSCLKTKSKKA